MLASAMPIEPPIPPSMNESNIHFIVCHTEDGDIYSGSGFIIDDGVLATANHVAEGECRDVTSGVALKTYKTDRRHDFALMTGNIKVQGPYIQYACSHPIPGNQYISYGITSYGLGHGMFYKPIERNNHVIATGKINKDPDQVQEFDSAEGMRYYRYSSAPGMSGGPVADLDGLVYAINNASDDTSSLNFDLADTGLCTGKWD